MGNLSEHFDLYEFLCPCGCGGGNPSKILLSMLEDLFFYMDADAIKLSNGYRCPDYSGSIPGGSRDDAHTRNMAVDCCVRKKDKSFYSSFEIAEAAERLGFKGIGIIDEIYCHLDTRFHEPYKYAFWFGNENTNEEYTTFQKGTIFPGQEAYEKKIGYVAPVDNTTQTSNSSSDNELERELQELLNEKGYSLDVDGIVGNLTLTTLRDFTIDPGDSGPLTKWTQKKLKSLGYNLTVNGVADEETMDAIHQFQKDHNLGVGKSLSGGDWSILAKS